MAVLVALRTMEQRTRVGTSWDWRSLLLSRAAATISDCRVACGFRISSLVHARHPVVPYPPWVLRSNCPAESGLAPATGIWPRHEGKGEYAWQNMTWQSSEAVRVDTWPRFARGNWG